MLAAGDEDLRAGDIAEVLAAQAIDGAGHLLGSTHSMHRNASISPGATALTRTPSSANSTAISLVKAESAALEVE
jgi:hypothetical protein